MLRALLNIAPKRPLHSRVNRLARGSKPVSAMLGRRTPSVNRRTGALWLTKPQLDNPTGTLRPTRSQRPASKLKTYSGTYARLQARTTHSQQPNPEPKWDLKTMIAAGVVLALIIAAIKDQIDFHLQNGVKGELLDENELYTEHNDSEYVRVSDLVPAGESSGASGHSCPDKVYLKEPNAESCNYYYHKRHSEVMREYVYHRLAEALFGRKTHPDVRLSYEPINNEKKALYGLLIESMGTRNHNLEDYALMMKGNPRAFGLIDKLARSVAFTLFGSGDNYFKNMVVSTDGAYPIDFEIWSSQLIYLMDPRPENAKATATDALNRGGLLEYETSPANPLQYLHQANSGMQGAEAVTDRGDGIRMYGYDVHEIIHDSIAEGIRNGEVLDLYLNMAKLTNEQVEDIVATIRVCDGGDKAAEKFTHEIKHLRNKVRRHLDQYEIDYTAKQEVTTTATPRP